MKRILLFLIGLAAMAAAPIQLQTAPMQAPAAPAAPMPDPRSAVVPRIDAQVKIDGVLDEQPWQKAARLTPFLRNDTMMPARVGTEVRLWYDQAALYLGWTCEDYDIQATFTQRDSRFWEVRSTPSSRTSSAQTAVRSNSKATGRTRPRA
jgi:hypothetical protein